MKLYTYYVLEDLNTYKNLIINKLNRDQRKSSKIDEIDNKFLPGIRVKSKSGKLDDPNTFLSTTAYNQKGKPLHQGVYDW